MLVTVYHCLIYMLSTEEDSTKHPQMYANGARVMHTVCMLSTEDSNIDANERLVSITLMQRVSISV